MRSNHTVLAFLKRHQIILVSVLLSLFSLHLALTDKKKVERGYILKEVISIAVSPVQQAVLGAYNSVAGAWNGYIALVDVNHENIYLNDRLIKLEAENNRLREEVLLNERLRDVLKYKESLPFETVAAGVHAFNIERWTRTIVIDKGSGDSIAKDMAVISPQGAVGRIIEVNGSTSRVLLNTDLRSNMDVIVQRTRTKGVVEGNGANGMTLKYIRELDDVKLGDVLVTSGFSGIFPKGLVVGEVSKLTKGTDNFFKQIEVAPSVDTSRLEEVLIVTAGAKAR